MSVYLGDFRTGKTVRKMWNTNAVAGESITRAANGTISVYKGGGTTQSTAGVIDTEDFDSLTGVHLVAIDTSADGMFYSAGSDFEVVLSAATIDGKAINATLFSFSLENRSGLMPTTDGRKLDISAGGEAGIDWANIGSPTTTVGLSGTTVKTATDVETDTADIQSRLPAALTGAGNIKADALAISGDATAADNAEAFFDGTGYAGTGNTIPTVTNLTNAPANGDLTATMKTSVTTAATAATPTAAAVTGAVGSVTGNVGGNVVGSVGSVIGLTASNLDATVSSRLATSSYTVPPTAAQNATAVFTTALTESYAALHAAPTLAQILFEGRAWNFEKAIGGTTATIKKINGSDTAATYTLDDATNPTSITRAS